MDSFMEISVSGIEFDLNYLNAFNAPKTFTD